MKIRRLTPNGQAAFRSWLESRKLGELPPAELMTNEAFSEIPTDIEADVDPTIQFASRFEFGKYLATVFAAANARALLSTANDGIWDWLALVYFSQLGAKVSKPWHYVVTRHGHSGSLAYRHLVRTSFEMYWRHGENSSVVLSADMSTWGDLSEQLTSRQNVAYHRGYMQAAKALYMANGAVIRGAASRTRNPKKRKPGETRGRGGVARLALAVRRLYRTYDTHALSTAQMLELLPKEFQHFSEKASKQQN